MINQSGVHFAVLGTGVVGLTTALGLAKLGHQVSLIGPRPKAGTKPIWALHPYYQDFFAMQQMWPHDYSYRINSMEIWSKQREKGLLLVDEQPKPNSLAYPVDANLLQCNIFHKMPSQVAYLEEDIIRLQRLDPTWQIKTQLSSLKVDFIIVADGANSKAAAYLGHHTKTVGTHPWETWTASLMITVPHEQRALQVMRHGQIVALLPDPQNQYRYHLVYSSLSYPWQYTGKIIEELKVLFGDYGWQFETEGHAWPIHLISRSLSQEKVVYLGDAAGTVHPLAGLGANLGLADSMVWLNIVQSMQMTSSRSVAQLADIYLAKRRVNRCFWQTSINQIAYMMTSSCLAHIWSQGLNLSRHRKIGQTISERILRDQQSFPVVTFS